MMANFTSSTLFTGRLQLCQSGTDKNGNGPNPHSFFATFSKVCLKFAPQLNGNTATDAADILITSAPTFLCSPNSPQRLKASSVHRNAERGTGFEYGRLEIGQHFQTPTRFHMQREAEIARRSHCLALCPENVPHTVSAYILFNMSSHENNVSSMRTKGAPLV